MTETVRGQLLNPAREGIDWVIAFVGETKVGSTAAPFADTLGSARLHWVLGKERRTLAPGVPADSLSTRYANAGTGAPAAG